VSTKFAAIDIGSNSSLLLILELEASALARVVVDTKASTRLSAGTQYGDAIGAEALQRQFAALDRFAGLLREHHVEATVACGTQVFRVASNGRAIAEEISRRYGWQMEIIAGEREAELSYKAATTGLMNAGARRIVLDVGGGSSEVVFGKGDKITWSKSYPVGAVSLTERFELDQIATATNLDAASAYLDQALTGLGAVNDLNPAGSAGPFDVIAVGGTATTLAAISQGQKYFVPGAIHGVELDRLTIQDQVVQLGSLNASQRRNLIPFDPDRSEIIVGGALIIALLMDKLDSKRITVSNCGLRWGLIIDAFPQLQQVEIAQ
jgi:exopolyphosphatase/guanosine-5'-triphosphate,3'-diphosphate pyrophosphatase